MEWHSAKVLFAECLSVALGKDVLFFASKLFVLILHFILKCMLNFCTIHI